MSHNMVLHLIIIHFKNPELSSTTNIFADYAGNITSIFICLLLLLLLLFCAFFFHPLFFVVAQHCTSPLFHLWIGREETFRRSWFEENRRVGEWRTTRWTDKCMSSHFLTECWRKGKWQRNHERALWASKHSWQTTLKDDAPDQGECVCTREGVCAQVSVLSLISEL